MAHVPIKGTLLGTPNREPQEYSSNILEYKDPARYVPIIFLLYSWVPNKVPLPRFRVQGLEMICYGTHGPGNSKGPGGRELHEVDSWV